MQAPRGPGGWGRGSLFSVGVAALAKSWQQQRTRLCDFRGRVNGTGEPVTCQFTVTPGRGRVRHSFQREMDEPRSCRAGPSLQGSRNPSSASLDRKPVEKACLSDGTSTEMCHTGFWHLWFGHILVRVPPGTARPPPASLLPSPPQVPEELMGGPGKDAQLIAGGRSVLSVWPQHGEALPAACLSVGHDADVVPKTQARLQTDRQTDAQWAQPHDGV